MINIKNSNDWFKDAQNLIPGGVNSPVRSFKGVDGSPFFVKQGKGAYLSDVDGNHYIDYVNSWGPLILGHAHPHVHQSVLKALEQGYSFGAPTSYEVELAEKICQHMPAIEMIRFVSSGTEAAMSAIRLARGFTKRNKIIKFAGCYHGHADSLLVAAGSGSLTLSLPSSAGVLANTAEQTLIADFNDLDGVAHFFAEYGNDIAAIILEPIAGNMNLVLPLPGFLQTLRQLCDQYGALLIFDEVITGFRVGLGGAQALYRITPDLTILGKIIGGGFPAAAFGGRREIMQYLAPLGPVYQAGTLSGHPIAMSAGLATLECLEATNFYNELEKKTKQLMNGLLQLAEESHCPFHATAIGGMFGMLFTEQKQIHHENDVKNCDLDLFKLFFHRMLKKGVYFAPSAYEIGFMSQAHSQVEIEKTISAAKDVFAEISLTKEEC